MRKSLGRQGSTRWPDKHPGALMTYTARVPFSLADSTSLTGLDKPLVQTVAPITYSLSRVADSYILTLAGLEDETAAEGSVRRVWTGLAWSLVQRGIPFTTSLAVHKASM